MKHIRIYTHTGGVVRFGYPMDELLEAVNAETQFTGRNIQDGAGNLDLNKMAGPDDIEFVVRSIKGAADTLDSFIPKHVKPSEFKLIVFSDKEVTITLADNGKTTKAILEQAYEQIRNFMVNIMLQMWYAKCGLPALAEPFGGYARNAMTNIQRVLAHSFITHRPYGSRYPKVSLTEVARPLKGKFLGSYKSEDTLKDVHMNSVEAADIAFIEKEKDYVVYDGTNWEPLSTLVTSATKLNATNGIAFPEADKGDVFFVTKTGLVGDYDDMIYAGEVLVCISDNKKTGTPATYHDSLKNFIVIGPIRADFEND
jgi:hypothetical protein